MKFSKNYQFQEWNDWDHTIAGAIDDFLVTYQLNPQILLCNKYTYSQIDFITTINPDKRKNVSPIDDFCNNDEQIQLAEFCKDNCNLKFGVDESLAIKEFSLVYDDEADWGDDEDEINTIDCGKSKKNLIIV
jgi:hypothetical protein